MVNAGETPEKTGRPILLAFCWRAGGWDPPLVIQRWYASRRPARHPRIRHG